jgi:hypothetical protein
LQKDRKHLHLPFYAHHPRVNNDIASQNSNAHKEKLKIRQSAITPIARSHIAEMSQARFGKHQISLICDIAIVVMPDPCDLR